MSKSLIITEKPSVAKDIAKALGGFTEGESHLESDTYVVSWAVGHVLEFCEPEDIDPRYRSWRLEDLPIIPEPFVFKPKSGQSRLVSHLGKLIKRSDVRGIINACDAGREGELIFREIVEWVGADKPTQRLWLQSMTPAAIRKAFTLLRDGHEFDRLGAAAHCRSEADWLIGINGTRALTRRMKLRSESSAWSVGRVQTPTLAMIVDRELEILRHRPEPFWRVVGTFAASDHEYEGTWFDAKFKGDPDSPRKDDWVTDPERLQALLDGVAGQPGTASETRKPTSEAAPPLFDLTSLQREANRRLGYSARRTLSAAQRLYEGHKLITYPRTDSRCLPEDYVGHVLQVIDQLGGRPGPYRSAAQTLKRQGLQNQRRNFDDSKVSDHFAIIPTTEMPTSPLSGDDLRVYDLIVRRFMAAFYPQATWIRVERVTEIPVPETGAVHAFRTRSRHLSEPGWYEVYGRDQEEDPALPPLVPPAARVAGEGAPPKASVRNIEVHPESDETRPPARITEARLLSLMEHAGKQVDDDDLAQILGDKGLGTPATRAEIIENLVLKQYALRAERSLRATPKGILLIDLLKRIDVDRLASPELTGEMEKHLREVEGGARTRDVFMREIQDYTREIVEHAKGFDYDFIYSHQPPLGECPVCRTRKVYEKARLYACEANTGKDAGECTFSLWKEKGGRYLDRFTVAELLTCGETVPLEGFLSVRGEGYRAALRINEGGGVDIVGEGGPAQALKEMPVNHEPVAPCPFDPTCEVFETPTHFQCRGICVQHDPKRKNPASLPREVCKRTITREEAYKLFVEGRTDLFDDFVSRYGKNFKAYLHLQDTGRHGFLFPPREPRKKKTAEDGEAPEGSAPRKARGGATRSSGGRGARRRPTSGSGAR